MCEIATEMSTNNPSIKTKTLRPLIFASSGGGGHIAAAMGILEWMRNDENDWISKHYPKLFLQARDSQHKLKVDLDTQHHAIQAKERWPSFLSILVKTSIFLYSTPWIGAILRKISNIIGLMELPAYKDFNTKLNALITETGNITDRPYVDFLLDLYPAGYELTAIFNALQANDKTQAINKTINSQASSDRWHYKIAYNKILRMLLKAAEEGKPYTEIVSTQPQAMTALCDAVIDYNAYVNKISTKINRFRKLLKSYKQQIDNYQTILQDIKTDNILGRWYHSRTQASINKLKIKQARLSRQIENIDKLSEIHIHQYLTDLPSDISEEQMHTALPRGAMHFLHPLDQLNEKQIKLIHIHAVDTSNGVEGSVNNYKLLHGLESIKTANNQMVRKGFKQPEILAPYATLTQRVQLPNYSTTHANPPNNQNIEIAADDKVYTIMLGSVAGTASTSYVNKFLDKITQEPNITHHIYIFTGGNSNLQETIEAQIHERSIASTCHIHYVPRINDADIIAKIETRSDYVVTRSGGLSIMEHMAIPLRENKRYYLHHPEQRQDRSFTTGLEWEDANARQFIKYIEKQKSTKHATVQATNPENMQFNTEEELSESTIYMHNALTRNSSGNALNRGLEFIFKRFFPNNNEDTERHELQDIPGNDAHGAMIAPLFISKV